MHDLQWFLDREGSYVLRGTTEVFIKDEAMARSLYELQSDTYKFDVKFNIHRAPVEECQSCSA